jgi:glycolate oxidase iron-sulfur subunit
MRALARGEIPATDDRLAHHLQRCLGCLACESACPSGVEYGPALEAVRIELARTHAPPIFVRLVLAVMAEPRLRRPLLAASRLLRPLARLLSGASRIGFPFGMLAATRMRVTLPDASPSGQAADEDALPYGGGTRRAVVFRGCIMEGLFSHVHDATERTLRVNGYALAAAPQQGCCGALHVHAGLIETAKALARRNVQAFAEHPEAAIAINSAGCGAALKQYGHLLAGDPLEDEARRFAGRVEDVHEMLAASGPRRGAPLAMTVAVDPPCHLQHAQHIVDEPHAVLGAVPGLECRSPADASHCCGSAGVFSVLERELSRQVLARKLDTLAQLAPDAVVTGNPGCVMQIGAGLLAAGRPEPVLYPVELLDLSYRRAGYYDATPRVAPPDHVGD